MTISTKVWKYIFHISNVFALCVIVFVLNELLLAVGDSSVDYTWADVYLLLRLLLLLLGCAAVWLEHVKCCATYFVLTLCLLLLIIVDNLMCISRTYQLTAATYIKLTDMNFIAFNCYVTSKLIEHFYLAQNSPFEIL